VTVITSERPAAAIDTSNFRKHTHANPLQRTLIDRFHHVIAARVGALAPATFLDAGCGEGFVSRHLLDHSPGLRIVGFDWNRDSVCLACRTNPSESYLVADITRLPFADGAFDVAGCFEVLEHLPDPRAALRELLRVSRRAVVLSVPHEPYFSLANAARGKNLGVHPKGSDPDHRQFWSRKAFGQFVEQEAAVEWIGGSFPWTVCVARPRG
jgi:ubiquinone/menaquinone biosynthesis C-methylase UbiE